MRIKRLAALSLAAVLTAGMLTGCPWDKEADETDDASSVPAASSSTSQPSSDDDDDTPAPPAQHTVTINGEKVTITADGKAQDIKLSGDSGQPEGTLTVTVTPNNKVTATIKPKTGFAIKSINDTPVPSDKRKEYTVSNLSLKDITSGAGDVAIDFAELQTVTVVSDAESEKKGEILISSNEVIEDDTLTVTVKANDGYVIDSVTVGSDNHTPKTDEEKEKMTVTYTVPQVSAKARSANTIQVSATFTEGMQNYTFTASVNTNGQDAPTRCYMQVCTADTYRDVIAGSIQGNTCTFNVSLQPNQNYTYLFWADNADNSSTPGDLRSVSYTFNTAAYAASTNGTPESVSKTSSITLAPVTTKITLQNTAADFEPKNDEQLTITLSCAETYNVQESSATNSAQYTYTHTFGSASTAVTRFLDALSRSGNEVCSFYALKPGNDVTIGFRDLELETTLSQDGVLSVDLSEDNPNWQATEAYRKKVFLSCFFNDDGTPKGTQNITYSFSGIEEDVKYLFEKILQKTYPTSDAAISNAVYLEIFGMQIGYQYFGYGTSLYFYIGDTNFAIYYDDDKYKKFVIQKLPGNN